MPCNCPSGFRQTIIGGVCSCTPTLSTAPETCSDSPFYRELTGLPACDNKQTSDVGVWPFSWPRSTDPDIRKIEDNVAEAYGRMQDARARYENARQQGQPTTGDIYVYPRMEEVPPPPLNLPSRADQKANIFNRAFDPKNRKIIVLVIAGFLLFLAVTNAK